MTSAEMIDSVARSRNMRVTEVEATYTPEQVGLYYYFRRRETLRAAALNAALIGDRVGKVVGEWMEQLAAALR